MRGVGGGILRAIVGPHAPPPPNSRGIVDPLRPEENNKGTGLGFHIGTSLLNFIVSFIPKR